MLGALHFYHPDSMLPYASGGILGEGLVGALRPLVSSGGVGLIAAALILSGFPLFSGMSWLQVADEIGKRICRLGGWLAARRQASRMRAAQRAAAKTASLRRKLRLHLKLTLKRKLNPLPLNLMWRWWRLSLRLNR